MSRPVHRRLDIKHNIPQHATLWVCQVCKEPMIETPEVMARGRIHISRTTGNVCDNKTKFLMADQDSPHVQVAIAAYLIGGWDAVRAMDLWSTLTAP